MRPGVREIQGFLSADAAYENTLRTINVRYAKAKLLGHYDLCFGWY